MSTKKEILTIVKDLGTAILNLGKDDKVKLEVHGGQQETLDNGTVIEAESFESGQAVFIVNEDERVALPVGKYTLGDGRELVVTEEGMIDTIGEAAEEENEEVDASEDFVTKSEFNEAIESIKAMFSKEKEDIQGAHKKELEKSEEDLKLAKEKSVKLQTEIDEKPDAKKIKVAPGTVKLNTKPATTPIGRIVQSLNKIA